jgi:hypothetical protein
VELCSAANAVEAHALRMLLEEAGIQARVVGDILGNAAGSLPLGEPIAPRIWVWETNVARAQEIIEEWTSQPHDQWGDLVEGAEQSEAEEDAVPSSAVGFHVLSEGLVIAGTACILWGALWAWHSWMTARKYQETTEGVLVAWEPHYSGSYYFPPPDTPVPRFRLAPLVCYDLKYRFVIDGKTYSYVVRASAILGRRMPIHYDPRDLKENVVVGPLTRPWLVLVATFGIGAFLAFMAYMFRKRATGGRQCDILDAADTP